MHRIDTITLPARVLASFAAAVLITALAALVALTGPTARSSAAPATGGKVVVINESTLPGLGLGVTKRLRGCGYSVRMRTATTERERHDTTLEHTASTKSEAARLAETMALPATSLVQKPDAHSVVVRLGTDQVQSGRLREKWVLRWPACR